MPWTPNDAERHTHKATTPVLKELWAKVALFGKRTPLSRVRPKRPKNLVLRLAFSPMLANPGETADSRPAFHVMIYYRPWLTQIGVSTSHRIWDALGFRSCSALSSYLLGLWHF
jgi:hypothetical protein